MEKQHEPFTVSERSELEDDWNAQVTQAERVNGEILPQQTPEPPGALMSWGVAAVIFAYIIPIVGILMAAIALSKVSNASKRGYQTKKMKTTKVLGIVALILAAVTIVVTAIMLRIPTPPAG